MSTRALIAELAPEALGQADAAEAAPAPVAPPGTEPNVGEQPTPEAPLLQPEPPPDVVDALRALVRQYELECDATRRHKVKVYQRCEEFWRGNQNIWWYEPERCWRALEEAPPGESAEAPRSRYVVNMYRPWGLSVMAALTMARRKRAFAPISAASQDDVATAEAASLIADLVERNNNLEALAVRKAYLLWNQGIYASYVRFLVDGGLFGYRDIPEYGDRVFQVLPDRFECPRCSQFTPASASPGLLQGSPVPCRQCGLFLGARDFNAAVHFTASVPTGTRRAPNGAEKIDVYGPLMFKAPPQAQNQSECYYLIQVWEVHKAALRAAYPQKADRIDASGDGAEDTYERVIRLSLTDTKGGWSTLPYSNLVTYKRAWLRPMAFWAHEDPATRDRLLQLYPQGCRVEFAGDVLLDVVPERMDDHWVICLGQEGQGLYRDPLGLDAVEVQQQINDTANILAEHRDFAGAPPVLYDARYINGEALLKRRMQPGSYYPVIIENAGLAKPMSEMIYQPRLNVDPALWNETENLAQTGQFITGALPSIFGGSIPNLATATAYAQSRDQALGRLRPIAKAMNHADCREITLAVECFQKNRPEDVELVVLGQDGSYRSRYIRLSMLRGRTIATPTDDDGFPQTWAEVSERLAQLLNTKDAEILKVLNAPVNRPLMKRYLGLPELVDPDEENRTKQALEIEALLASGPLADALPTIAPDLYVDDHAVHAAYIREWAVSEIGRDAKATNPAGYANVEAHLLAHLAAERQLSAPPNLPQEQSHG